LVFELRLPVPDPLPREPDPELEPVLPALVPDPVDPELEPVLPALVPDPLSPELEPVLPALVPDPVDPVAVLELLPVPLPDEVPEEPVPDDMPEPEDIPEEPVPVDPEFVVLLALRSAQPVLLPVPDELPVPLCALAVTSEPARNTTESAGSNAVFIFIFGLLSKLQPRFPIRRARKRSCVRQPTRGLR
jgi:hypothetical protein